MGRTTVFLEPRRVQSMHVDGELMDKQVGTQLAFQGIDEYSKLS